MTAHGGSGHRQTVSRGGGGHRMGSRGHGHLGGGGERHGHSQQARADRNERPRTATFHEQPRRDVATQERRGDFRDNRSSLAVSSAGTNSFSGPRFAEYRGHRSPIDGCPPGLAVKNNGCLPPGQVRKQWGYGAPLAGQYINSFLPMEYRSWYPDSNDSYYRYGDGYAYRVDRSDNFVTGLFPLDNEVYYSPGDYYPAAYDFYNVPAPYQQYYPDGGAYDYRYGDGAIYQVDRGSGTIDSIVALLTGGMAVGQPLPDGYDVYNVPEQYRDRYYDTPDAEYRYADGNIYRADPKTQIIQAIISALA